MPGNEADEENKAFKPIESALPTKDVEAVRDEVENELRPVLAKLRDPVFLASVLYMTVREKENTNRLLKNIYARLDALEARIGRLEGLAGEARRPAPVLPDVDQRIVDFVRQKGLACAEDVQSAFGYKGRNAASARLNNLFELGVLEKVQAGRKVFYRLPESRLQGDQHLHASGRGVRP
ncbi:MAG: hypothetical protein QXH27_04040 [Candidatus Micrarchaeia archaeon]